MATVTSNKPHNTSDSARQWDTEAVQEVREHALQAGREVGAMAKSAGRAATEQIDNVKQAVVDQAASLEETITAFVEERPIQSMMIAAGVGLLVGMVWFRR